MSRVVELLCSRRVPHVAALALMSIGFAGCSADMSTRLSQNSFSNPFASQPEATGSVPTPAVERRELPQYSRPQSHYQSQALPPPIAAPQSYPAANAGVSGGGRGLASYAPPAHPIETTGSVAPRSVAATHGAGQARRRHHDHRRHQRHARDPGAPLQCYARRDPAGQRLQGSAHAVAGPATDHSASDHGRCRRPALAAPASKPVAAAAAPSVHVVNPGDTLLSIARRNHVSLSELARANNIDPQAKIKLGMKLTVPAAKTAAAAPAAPPAAVAAAQPAAALAPPATRMAAAGPQQSARLAQATTKIEEPAAEAPVKAAEATGALPTFRWPVRGKVITSYGAKTNGKANDGINLAVPEGTPVKAAEDGVVAYSGNELKGYGNLVLVRHSNGYVTAYAHASELLVKRGDTIKRGQIIAKSGQSGEVGSPQLHFEIRKGSSPVDPLQFLNGA